MFGNPMNNQIYNYPLNMNQMNQNNFPNMLNQFNMNNQNNMMMQNNQNNMMIQKGKNKKIADKIDKDYVKKINEQIFVNNRDPKKNLKFVDSNKKYYDIFFPKYISKKELYEIVETIFDKINLLIFKDNVIDYNDTSIDEIEEGSEIIILFKDESYADYLNEKYKLLSKINISCSSSSSLKIGLYLPNEVSISQMIKAIMTKIYSKNNLNNYYILYNGTKLDFNDNRPIKSLSPNLISLTFVPYHEITNLGPYRGKKIKIIIFNKESNVIKSFNYFKYEPLNEMFLEIEKLFEFTINKIYLGTKELKKNEEKTLASIGVKNDIFCNIESDCIYLYLI